MASMTICRLTSLQTTQVLERRLIMERRRRLTFRSNLLRAIGGVWSESWKPNRRKHPNENEKNYHHLADPGRGDRGESWYCQDDDQPTRTTTRSEQDSVTPLVQVLTVKSHEVTPVLEAFGEVRAHREVQIQAQVSGITTVIDDRLIVGGIFKSGEELMRIQPIDFELAVDQREADLALARMQHELELGRQEVAKREWQLLGDKQPVEASRKRLALRVPQLRQAEIALTAAESALQRAQLDLDRTIIRSPFNASVLSENAEEKANSSPQPGTFVVWFAPMIIMSSPLYRKIWPGIFGPWRTMVLRQRHAFIPQVPECEKER